MEEILSPLLPELIVTDTDLVVLPGSSQIVNRRQVAKMESKDRIHIYSKYEDTDVFMNRQIPMNNRQATD